MGTPKPGVAIAGGHVGGGVTGPGFCRSAVAGPRCGGPRGSSRGCTPVVRVSGKGTGRVSVAGLACYRSGARSRLFYRARVHRGRKGERRSMSEADYASLIAAAHNQLHAPMILVWDNLNTHVSAAMCRFIGAHPDWLTEARLPAYAPDLNAVEGAWANMKNGLGNLSASDVDQLSAIIKTGSKASSTGPPSSTASSPRPGSASNPDRRRPQPFNLCKQTSPGLRGVSTASVPAEGRATHTTAGARHAAGDVVLLGV
jgi:hypothetical protein